MTPHEIEETRFLQSDVIMVFDIMSDIISVVVLSNLGVPQGSVSGLLLFYLYIHELKEHLDGKRTLRLFYADDLQVYIQVPPHAIQQGVNLLSEVARRVATWAGLNSLTLNGNKTKAIVFGSSHTIKLFDSMKIPSITVNGAGEQVQFVNEVASLGVKDNTSSWRPQDNHVIQKVNGALFGLKFIKSCKIQTLWKRLVE